jgi:hypothetical protein
MIAAEQTFDGTWPYPARFTEAAGFRQHYVDEGPERPDHTIVMLHGEPTWGYEWRHLIGPLSRHHRVLVPDHMGFGKSETPEDRTYDASEHISNRCSSTRSISRISPWWSASSPTSWKHCSDAHRGPCDGHCRTTPTCAS